MGLEEFHIPFPLSANPCGDLLLFPYQISLSKVPQVLWWLQGLHGVSRLLFLEVISLLRQKGLVLKEIQ